MLTKSVVSVLAVLLFISPLWSQNRTEVENKLKDYFNQVVVQVKQTEDSEEKRAILNNAFQKFFKALDEIENLTTLSTEDRNSLTAFRAIFQEKYDELNGLNGFDKVPDEDLNEFANYVQQDLEQADRTITISLTTLLIIIIIVLLLD